MNKLLSVVLGFVLALSAAQASAVTVYSHSHWDLDGPDWALGLYWSERPKYTEIRNLSEQALVLDLHGLLVGHDDVTTVRLFEDFWAPKGKATFNEQQSLASASFGAGLHFDLLSYVLLPNTNYVLEVISPDLFAAKFIASIAPVSPVPLPGAALLFGSALLGMLGFRARRKVASAT